MQQTDFSRTKERYVLSPLKSPTYPKENKVLEIYTYNYYSEIHEHIRKKQRNNNKNDVKVAKTKRQIPDDGMRIRLKADFLTATM